VGNTNREIRNLGFLKGVSMSPTLRASALALSLSLCALAQPAIDLPRQSPPAVVSQTFGYATATVKYARPAVNGRVIWGGVVPYGRVWRAGANEPTKIEFSRDVAVNGRPLPAGAYELFVLPEKKSGKDAWTFIFNRATAGWGAFGYDAKDDALRVTVAAERAPHEERMAFSFDQVADSGATLALHWERLKGVLSVTSEFLGTGKANIAKDISSIKPDDPYSWLNAARFTWTYAARGAAGDTDRKQALEWVDKSIAVKPLFNNLWAKAQWLAESKRYAEAKEAGKLARAEAAKDPNVASQVPEMERTMKGWR
jgi:hypothetical protein